MDCPFQLNGNWFVQIVVLVVLVNVVFTARINVAMLSQPEILFKVFVYVPAAVMDCPFQLYGNWFVQIVVLVVLVNVAFTARFNVAMLSQPDALVSVLV